MDIVEDTPRRLVLTSRASTLTLDKDAEKATLQRRLLLWKRKPVEQPLSHIVEVTADVTVDRASGVEIYNSMLVSSMGSAWAFPAGDNKEAAETARRVRDFLNLPPSQPNR